MSDNKKPGDNSDAALKARLAQLELENRMRLQAQQLSTGADPFKDTPRRGFGSAQGIAHLRHTEFQRRGPNPPPPPPVIPEPGKARFGGTYLKTPLPGIISADATPGNELIAPTPATPSAPLKDSPQRSNPASPLAPATGRPPSATVPGAGATPSSQPPTGPPAREAAQTKPAPVIPPAAQFDPGKRGVIGGGGLSKAPLPAVYHAGVKAAEAADKSQAARVPAPPVGQSVPTGSSASPIPIPEGSEITKDGPSETKTTRIKRFKNPTLGPTE